MTPQMAKEPPKNKYSPRLVLAGLCEVCGAMGFVDGYDKDKNGKLRSNTRYCKCSNEKCNHRWKKRPEGNQ